MQNVIDVSPARTVHWRNTIMIVTFHIATAFAIYYFSWKNLAAMLIGNWIVGSLGVGLGYHRLLTHRSFKAPKWLEYTLTVFGTLAMQDDAPRWVTTHRLHHQYTETDKDPHSANPGFIWAHIGWIVTGIAQDHDQATINKYVPDLMKDRFHVLLAKFFIVPLVISAGIFYAIGGWDMVLWGVFARVVFGWHSTWLVNSATHLWGGRDHETTDTSTNNAAVAILTFGEGWHNNHHAFPTSARHGLKWYQFDQNWITIRIFEKLGWARDVKTVSAER